MGLAWEENEGTILFAKGYPRVVCVRIISPKGRPWRSILVLKAVLDWIISSKCWDFGGVCSLRRRLRTRDREGELEIQRTGS